MMKNLFIFALLFVSVNLYAQEKTRYNWLTTYSGITNAHFGLKFGRMGNKIGLYAGCRFGQSSDIVTKYEDEPFIGPGGMEYYNRIGDFEENKLAYAFIVGLTTNVYQNDNEKLLLQTGAGLGRWYDSITDRDKDGGLELELGLQYHYKRFIFQTALNYVDNFWSRRELDATLGIGLCF